MAAYGGMMGADLVQGTLGEFLIENGADDTLENNDGLTPYDGLGEG